VINVETDLKNRFHESSLKKGKSITTEKQAAIFDK